MTTLLERRNGHPRAPGSGTGVVGVAALAAVQAAAASLSVVLVPVVLAWATASFSSAPWGQALRLGLDAWLLAQHTGIVIPGGHVGLVPLALSAVPLVCCWFAGVRLARNLDPRADDVRAGLVPAAAPPARALAALVGSYALIAALAAVLGTSGPVRPLVAQAFLGAATVALVGGVSGAAAWEAGGAWAGLRLVVRRLRAPRPVLRVVPAAATALGVQLAAGLLLLVVAVVLRWDEVVLLHRSLHPGPAGGLVLVLAQLTVVPNLIVWALAFAAGPGFAVGTGSAVAPAGTHLGPLPAVPVLGALPGPGEYPAWIWALAALPVLAGAVAGHRIWRRQEGTAAMLLDAAVLTVLHGLGWAALAWLSGGPAGPGRLADVGPSVWRTALALAGETGAGALLVIGTGLLMTRLAAWDVPAHDPAANPAAPEPTSGEPPPG
jgi:hypothetical protein